MSGIPGLTLKSVSRVGGDVGLGATSIEADGDERYFLLVRRGLGYSLHR